MKIELDDKTYLEVDRIKADVIMSIKTKKDNKTSVFSIKLKKEEVSTLLSKLIVLKSEQELYEAK